MAKLRVVTTPCWVVLKITYETEKNFVELLNAPKIKYLIIFFKH
jgi:hypothetical protein